MLGKYIALFTLFMMNTAFLMADTGFNEDTFKVNLSGNTHKIKLLTSGLASLEQRLEMIEQAEKTIDVEYFIYNADKSGKLFTQSLINKAKQGVKVRVLLDYFMIKNQITPFHIYELKKEGIEVKYYNSTSTLNLVRGFYRNHRKVLIVDGINALTGGRNIGDEYFDLRSDFNFLDREIYVEGDIVKNIQDSFNIIWNSEIAISKDREKEPNLTDSKYALNKEGNTSNFESELSQWREKEKVAQNFINGIDQGFIDEVRIKAKALLAREYEGKCDNISFNSEFPIVNKSNRDYRIIKHDIFKRITQAKESIVIDSPYFLVNDESKNALNLAISNKVLIKVLTNGLNSTDAVYVFDVFSSIVKEWIKNGLTFFMFKGERPSGYEVINEQVANARFGVHSKTFVIDNKDVVIGTYNFDSLSANYNAEMTITCENNPEMAKIVTEDIEKRMGSSFKLDTIDKFESNEFYKVNFLKKLEYIFLKIPSNIFSYLL